MPKPISPGSARRGPDFYVWDEDAREAERWSAELARASRDGALRRPRPSPEAEPSALRERSDRLHRRTHVCLSDVDARRLGVWASVCAWCGSTYRLRLGPVPARAELRACAGETLRAQDLLDAWPVLSTEERLEGLHLLPRAEAQAFYRRLDPAQYEELLLGLSPAERELWMQHAEAGATGGISHGICSACAAQQRLGEVARVSC